MITKYEKNCAICGTPVDRADTHHLLMGSLRHLADDDGLYIPICRICHTELHQNTIATELSKICGQLAYEKHKVAEGLTEDEAREAFRFRYQRSYL